MNSSQIRCFLDLSRTRNFTKTANNLYLTQQAVSRRIRSLEDSLGAALFVRSKNDVRLTDAGLYYQSVFTTVMEQFEEFKKEADLYYEILSSSIKIGYSEWLDRYGRIADGLTAFHSAMPNIQTTSDQMTNRELFEALCNNKIDIAIFSSEQTPTNRELVSTPIANEDIRLFGPSKIVEASPQDAYVRCWDLPLIFTSSWEYDYLEQSLLGAETRKALGLLPSRTKIVSDIASQFAELQFNNVAAIGDYNFGAYRRIQNLSSVSLGVNSYICCVWRANSENPLIQKFVNFMQNYYGFQATDT